MLAYGRAGCNKVRGGFLFLFAEAARGVFVVVGLGATQFVFDYHIVTVEESVAR